MTPSGDHGSAGTILVLPGGGYRTLAEHEGEPIAEWLRGFGWSAVVCRYPTGERHPVPLHYVQEQICRARADAPGPVGVIGFSAGGHLAGLAAVLPADQPASRPDFAILSYPVVSMIDGPHLGSREAVLGSGAPLAAQAALSLERLVDASCPPMFLWHTRDDPMVSVRHARLLAEALGRAGVAHEYHELPGDAHGVALAAGTPAQEWTSSCAHWLADLRHSGRPLGNAFPALELGAPLVPVR